MTRLLVLAACLARAFATMDYNMGGSMNGGEMGKNAMDMSSGSNAAVVDISITVISSYKGGNAPVEKIAEPSMAKGMMHKVTVGGEAGLIFSPSSLMAAPGDMVEFVFMSQNHTLTQSTFPIPCKKMEGGVDSDFLPNPNNTISPPPTYMFQVKDTKPAWFYCKQKKPTSHCGKGMTFSINPTPEKSHEMFMQMAIQQNGTAAAPGMSMGMGNTMTTMAPAKSTVTAPSPPPATTSEAAPPPASPPPPAAAPPADAPPVAAAPPPAAPPASPPASMESPPGQNLAAAPAAMAPATGMVAGTGSMSNGQCSCSCLCGTAAFPAGAGIGMYGGMSGAVAM